MINEESHHSKWEEFRRLALNDSLAADCSNLIKRMELEDSDDEECMSITENESQPADAISLEELISQDKNDKDVDIPEEKEAKKVQKRKWGPTLRMERPRRGADDARTMLQKAQDLKKYKNLEQGCKLEWAKEGALYDWKNAERVATHVQAGCPGESGVYRSTSGTRSKLGAADQLEAGFIRVGTIRCLAFGGLKRCDLGSM